MSYLTTSGSIVVGKVLPAGVVTTYEKTKTLVIVKAPGGGISTHANLAVVNNSTAEAAGSIQFTVPITGSEGTYKISVYTTPTSSVDDTTDTAVDSTLTLIGTATVRKVSLDNYIEL